MNRFYKQLALYNSPADSMAEAKREMLRKFGGKNPSSWAAFVVEGSNLLATDKQGKQPSSHTSMAKIVTVALIAVLGLLWAYKNRFTDYP